MLFGLPLGLVGACKRALGKNHEAFRYAAAEADRKGKLVGIAAIGTLLTGVGLIFNFGGFALVPKNFHMALGLMLIALALSVAVMKPATAKLNQAASGEDIDRNLAEKSLKTMAIGSGILQLLWVVMLVLMNYHF